MTRTSLLITSTLSQKPSKSTAYATNSSPSKTRATASPARRTCASSTRASPPSSSRHSRRLPDRKNLTRKLTIGVRSWPGATPTCLSHCEVGIGKGLRYRQLQVPDSKATYGFTYHPATHGFYTQMFKLYMCGTHKCGRMYCDYDMEVSL